MNKPTYIEDRAEILRGRLKFRARYDGINSEEIEPIVEFLTSELQGLGERIIEEIEKKRKIVRLDPEKAPSPAYKRIAEDGNKYQDGHNQAINDVIDLIRSLTLPDSSKE